MLRRLLTVSGAWLVLALTGLPAYAADTSGADQLRAVYIKCETDVRSALPENATVADGVQALRDRFGHTGDQACGMVELAGSSPADRVSALETELTRLQADYLGATVDTRPECEALAGAEVALYGRGRAVVPRRGGRSSGQRPYRLQAGAAG